ncbi:MAG: hypothetical protein CL849_05790, partial [Crocinitomicaceae bacterium]|nr:hypothetical protein [Crocinitomicaceae bacterium]
MSYQKSVVLLSCCLLFSITIANQAFASLTGTPSGDSPGLLEVTAESIENPLGVEVNSALFSVLPPDEEGPTITIDPPSDVNLTGCWSDFTYSIAAMGKPGYSVQDDCGEATVTETVEDTYTYCTESDDSSPEGGLTIEREFTYVAVDCFDNETTASYVQTITVTDLEAPSFNEVLPGDITVDCESIPEAATLTATDNCDSDANVAFSEASSTTCAGIVRTWIASDDCGNTTTHVQNITVTDDEAPEIVDMPADITKNADTGFCSTTVIWDQPTATDNCTLESLTADHISGDTYDVGETVVTYTAKDDCGNSTSLSFTITILDVEDPTIVNLPSDFDVNTDLGVCGAEVTWAEPTPADNCPGSTIARTEGPESGSVFSVGEIHTITYTATDDSGNTHSESFTIEVTDIELPQVLTQDLTVELDAEGNGSTTAAAIDNGSSDACGIASISLDKTDFDCTDVGLNTVTLTVTDNNGNEATATATVTVQDNVDPEALVQDVTVQLDTEGNGSTTAAAVDNGSNDACGIASMSLSQTDFDCTHVGPNTVTLTVIDNNGNESEVTATVTVEDNVNPIAIAYEELSFDLDETGYVGVKYQWVDSASSDACGLAPQPEGLSISQEDFDCSDVGPNTVTLTVTDVNGNVATTSTTININDFIAPEALAQDLTVQLASNGTASIVPAQVDNGSNDACGIAGMSLSQTAFDCSHVGPNAVTLTVTDVNGNESEATATVTVEDNIAPQVVTQDVTVELDETGAGSITINQVDNGSLDACGIASMSLSQTVFDCSHVGPNTVTLTVMDVNGNVSMAAATVTVQDNIAPEAMAQDFTVQLDSNGAASIDADDIDNGSSDACGIASMSLDQSTFDCSHVGLNTVTLTVTDINGNASIATATVTVEDNISPVALTQNITVQLDSNGAASIDADDIDNDSSDACGIASMSL